MLSIGLVESMIAPSAGAIHLELKKLLGKPTSNVVATPNLSLSRANTLCKWVVPVLGCPTTNTGSSLKRTLRTLHPYSKASTHAPIELNADITVKNAILGAYVLQSIACARTTRTHWSHVMPLSG